jgi:hypothetical protein
MAFFSRKEDEPRLLFATFDLSYFNWHSKYNGDNQNPAQLFSNHLAVLLCRHFSGVATSIGIQTSW